MPIVQASMAARKSTGLGPQGVLNALTVDVEDYFQVSAFDAIIARSRWDTFESRIALGTAKILSALDAAGVRATFFLLGWVAEHHPDLVRQIHAAGHEIGCHGYWHELVYQQTPETFRNDLRRARRAVGDAVGEQVAAYRAPSFSITRRSIWALDILIDEGFVIDSSIYPTVHDRYGLPGAPLGPHRIVRAHGSLWEFPLPVCRLFGWPLPVGGGGYFRLYPYGLTRAWLRALNEVGRPFATYIHPWELDPEQPRLTVGWLRAFRHYVNLHRTEERLKQLLADFRFGTLSDAFAGIHENDELPTWEPTAA